MAQSRPRRGVAVPSRLTSMVANATLRGDRSRRGCGGGGVSGGVALGVVVPAGGPPGEAVVGVLGGEGLEDGLGEDDGEAGEGEGQDGGLGGAGGDEGEGADAAEAGAGQSGDAGGAGRGRWCGLPGGEHLGGEREVHRGAAEDWCTFPPGGSCCYFRAVL